MSDDTHDGLADTEKANVGTSGGKTVTDSTKSLSQHQKRSVSTFNARHRIPS